MPVLCQEALGTECGGEVGMQHLERHAAVMPERRRNRERLPLHRGLSGKARSDFGRRSGEQAHAGDSPHSARTAGGVGDVGQRDTQLRGLVSSYPSVMILPTAVQQHEWMMQWRSAAVELERVRLHELAAVDLARVAADLEDCCVVSALTARDSQGSGLIEQQRWLHRRGQA